MPLTDFVRLYTKPLVALFLLLIALFLIQRYAYVLVTIAAFGSILGLIMGFSNPESLRFLFRSKTSKANVCWSFAFLIFVFGSMGASMEPPEEMTSNGAAVLTHSKDVVVKVPTSVSPSTVSSEEKRKRPTARKQAPKGATVPQESKEPAEADDAKAGDGDLHSPNLNSSDDEDVREPSEDRASTSTDSQSDIDSEAPKVSLFGTHDIKSLVSPMPDRLVVINQDKFAYRQVSIIINSKGLYGGYFYEVQQIAPGERLDIDYADFATKKDERRFDPTLFKLENITIRCKTDYGIGLGVFAK